MGGITGGIKKNIYIYLEDNNGYTPLVHRLITASFTGNLYSLKFIVFIFC